MIDGIAVDRGRAYRAFHYAMILVVALAAAIVAVAIGLGIRERFKPDERLKTVKLFADGSSVADSSSLLTRGDHGIDFTLKSSGLPAGHVITLRAEIFNDPGKCRHRDRSRRCGADDLADPAVDGSVVFITSNYLRGSGAVNFSGHLDAGDASHAISGRGLANPQSAAVYLIVVDRGPALQGLYRDQLTTIGGGCTNPPSGGGVPGPNKCVDLQYAAHD